MRPSTPDYRFAHSTNLSSPPETPTSPIFFPLGQNAATRQQGQHKSSTPDGAGSAHNRFTASLRPNDISPRSASPPHDSSDESSNRPCSEDEESDIAPETARQRAKRAANDSDFSIYEMRLSDGGYDSDGNVSVMHPDQYEDATSDPGQSIVAAPDASGADKNLEHELADGLGKLDCNNDDPLRQHEAWSRQQRKIRRLKRLSGGILHKRTISQSIGSDTDEEDLTQCDANEAGSSARRLRRKTVSNRNSLLFSDPPQVILEMKEPHEDRIPDVRTDIEEHRLHSLPYHDMDIDTDGLHRIESVHIADSPFVSDYDDDGLDSSMAR